VDLPPSPIEGDRIEWHALNLDDHDGLVAVGAQHGLDDLIEWGYAATLAPGLVRLSHRHHEPPRGLARLHAPAAFPIIGPVVQPELPTDTEVAAHLSVPTVQAGGDGER